MSAYKAITTGTATVSTTLVFPNRATINNMPTGTANSVMTTNGSGIPAWGNAPIAAITPGSNEQSLWTSGGVSTWLSRSFRYGVALGRFSAIDWNAGATTSLTYTGQTLNSNSFGTTAFTNFTTSTPNTSLLCNTTNYYMFSMYSRITNGGAGTSTIGFNIMLNGVASGGGPSITLGPGASGTISFNYVVVITATQIVSFQANRISGTDSMTADSTNSQFSLFPLQTVV